MIKLIFYIALRMRKLNFNQLFEECLTINKKKGEPKAPLFNVYYFSYQLQPMSVRDLGSLFGKHMNDKLWSGR